MTITRRGLHEEIERQDKIIADANADKATFFKSYREQLEKAGRTKADIKLEIDAFKKAHRKVAALAKNGDAEIERDDLVDEIVAELQKPVGTRNAIARTTRETKSAASPPSGGEGAASGTLTAPSTITPDAADTHGAGVSASAGDGGSPGDGGAEILTPEREWLPEFLDRRGVIAT